MTEHEPRRVKFVKGNPPLACLLTSKEILESLPTDHRFSDEGASLAFTHMHPEQFAVPVPVYEELPNLAAWVYGYMAGASKGFPEGNPAGVLGE